MTKYRAKKVLACGYCGAQLFERAHTQALCPRRCGGQLVQFASRREYSRFMELKWAERAGQIEELERQPAFPVWINGTKVATYRADFRYWENGEWVIEDSKGADPAADRLRRRCAEAYYGMEVRLT